MVSRVQASLTSLSAIAALVFAFALSINAHADTRTCIRERTLEALAHDFPNVEQFHVIGTRVSRPLAVKFQKRMQNEFDLFFKPLLEEMKSDLHAQGVRMAEVQGRVKTVDSILEKMHGRYAARTLDQLTDGIAGEIVLPSLRDLRKTLRWLSENHKITVAEIDDFTYKARRSGYRGAHLLIRTPSGALAELQLHTHNEHVWWQWDHDLSYKGGSRSLDPEVMRFRRELSDYLFTIDRGLVQKISRPRFDSSNGIEIPDFPWDQVDQSPTWKRSKK